MGCQTLMNLPSLQSLECFDAAARLLNFREAAKVVCITPAALGQRIKQLEEQLGVVLFHRTTRTVRLTEAGLALVPRVRACIEAAESCVRAVQADGGPPPQELTLGTTYEIGTSWITPALAKLNGVLPQVTIHVYFGSGPDILARVKSMELDCAVTSNRVLDPAYDAFALHDEDYALVGARELLAELPLERIEDAAEHTLIDVRPDLPMLRYVAESPACPAPLKFARVQIVGSTEAIRKLVLDRRGVAVLPKYLIRGELADGSLKALLPDVQPLTSAFRLVFAKDDTRRTVFEAISKVLVSSPLS
jgi:LysR family transcriptional regulator, glycine cleavage system transcriptional activator